MRRVCLCLLFGVREGKAAAQGHQAAQEEEAEEETQKKKWSEQTKNVEKQCEKYTVQQQALILAGKETASFPLSTLCSLVFLLADFCDFWQRNSSFFSSLSLFAALLFHWQLQNVLSTRALLMGFNFVFSFLLLFLGQILGSVSG